MLKLIGVAVIACFWSVSVFAQQTDEPLCRMHFVVAERIKSNGVPLTGFEKVVDSSGITQGTRRRSGMDLKVEYPPTERSGLWPEQAAKWWTKDGKKKFPKLCETDREHADFSVVWVKELYTQAYRRPLPIAPSADPRVDLSCLTDLNGEQFCTAVPTHPETEDSWADETRQVERVTVFVYDVRAGKSVLLKNIVKTGHSLWGRPPVRDSFEAAMKFLQKQK